MFNTIGSRFDTLLAVYTGPDVQSLTLEAANDDINPFARIFTSRVFLNVVEGQEYRIAIDGFAGTRGPTVLNWASGTPSNDNFSSAQVLIDQSGTVTGATLFATKELGEPDHAFSLGGHSIWYEWTLPLEGFATIDLSGSTFDTLLAVYTGESVDALTLVTQNDDSLGTPRSRVQFITEPGVTYHIAVDGYAGDQGSVTLTYSNEIVPVVIRTQPQSRDAIVGEQVQFRVTADGIPAHYQWYLNGAAVPGAQIPTLTFTNVQATNAGNYTIVITNALSAVTSSVARLTVSVDLRQAWLARYDGGNDQPAALKVDSNGNVYVTGTSYGGTYNDYATLKYGADGSLLWVARFDGVNGTDAAQDLAIDDVGNVYVTGYSYGGNATGFDIATVKYDAAGVRQWVARYDGPVHGEDVAYALKVDSTGNVYVTGYTTNSGGGIDFATVKYDRNGNQLWAAIYDGPGHGSDYGYDVAVDVAGNVIVTGPSYGGATTTNDYTTIKYGPGGNQLWVARYNGPGNGADIPFRVVLDGAGNPYVTGRSVGSGTGSDYATLKYNSTNGAQMWVARYNGPANNTDFGLRLALDSATNVFVTGVSYGGASNYFDYATVKYSPSGGQLWVSRYTGPGAGFDSPFALVVDGTGNAYVAGYSDGGPDATNDFVTLKYAANGTQLWAARYDGPAHGDDRAWAIAVDSASNVYVAGQSSTPGAGDDYVTVKYVQNARPTVRITSPTENATFLLPTNVLISVNATDPDQNIARVDFYNGSINPTNKIGESTVAPFDFNWTNAPAGTARLIARVFDDVGAFGSSSLVTIQLLVRNQPPTFTPGPDQLVREDAGSVSAANWATNISPGPRYEASQTLSFLVSNNNSNLFAAQPFVSTNGTLTYTPAANANGAAEVTVILRDNGGTNLMGMDTSLPHQFSITVLPVNDLPSFVKGPDIVAIENGGTQTIPGWATAISAGPVDEFGQSLTFLTTSANNTLFLVPPVISPDGTLSFIPASNACGAAMLSAQLRDNGGADNGGSDASAPQFFTITIRRPLPRLTSPSKLANGQFRFTLLGDAGRTYTIEASTDLKNWILLTNFVSSTGTNEVVDPNASNFDHRFYRARTAPASPPRLLAPTSLTSSPFRLTLVGEAGRCYTIEASTNLVNWTALTNFVSATSTSQFTDPTAPGFNRRFYRAVAP